MTETPDDIVLGKVAKRPHFEETISTLSAFFNTLEQAMSETRAAYNVAMQPGRELDRLVAEAMGLKLDYEFADLLGAPTVPSLRDQYDEWGILPEFSTDPAAAMGAWAWLEENHPWKLTNGHKCDIYLMQGRVYVSRDGGTVERDYYINGPKDGQGFFIQGSTYPHAISLAIVEAGKALGVIDVT